MESLEFIAVIVVFAAILAWYLQNTAAGDDGSRGLLALRADPEDAERPERSYRLKSRITHRARARQQSSNAGSQKSSGDRVANDIAQRMRRKFRRQDEARYRVKDRRPKDPETP